MRMPLASKAVKRSASKRKQNGKKVVKSQVSKSKQKIEMESTPKEQISELEKEIFAIKIHETESKLRRKRQLCSYMEEEASLYRTLYSEKQLLKSESMVLLDRAFEDFATEIFLLDEELRAMHCTFDHISRRRIFCDSYREKVKKLDVLETKLKENFFESEKCLEELPHLSDTFAELEEKARAEKERFDLGKETVLREFETCLLRIQSDLRRGIEVASSSTDLKLDLLPLPYKSLFLSGWLSGSWLESASRFRDHLRRRNEEAEREYNDLLMSSIHGKRRVKNFFSDKEMLILFQLKRTVKVCIPKEVSVLPVSEEYSAGEEVLKCLEKSVEEQRCKIESMRREAVNLEKAIQSLEVSGVTYLEKSYLVQIVFKAGNILKQEL